MTGQNLVDWANKHIGEPYILGSLAPKDDVNYKGPWDCAEFVSTDIYQVAGIAYAWANNKGKPHTADSYTGYFDRDAHEIGKIIPIDEAKRTPGAALLRVAGNGITGHIVLSMGNNKTVEAHSHADGVIHSVVDGRRWDYGILIPGIDYTEIPSTTPVVQPKGIIYRFTRPAMVSPVIGRIQKRLTELGFDTKGTDNVFGENTFNAVRSFQQSKGLVADGEVFTATAAALGISLSV